MLYLSFLSRLYVTLPARPWTIASPTNFPLFGRFSSFVDRIEKQKQKTLWLHLVAKKYNFYQKKGKKKNIYIYIYI